MKSMGGGGVVILHPQDSYTNHHAVDNMFNTPKKSHRNVKFNHHHHQHPAADNRTRTQPKGKNINRNKKTATVANKSNEFFAGFAFVESPPPSSVPLPGFFTKNMMSRDADPTTELRRILGLTLSN